MIALILFVVGAFTDYLDGSIARRYNIISDFGKIMDPLADKFLVLAALAGLTWLPPYRLPLLIFVIISLRELIITILREIYKHRKIVIPADKLGKVKTVMQMAGIVVAMLLWAITPDVSPLVVVCIRAWFWIVAIITIISGLNYIVKPQTSGGKT